MIAGIAAVAVIVAIGGYMKWGPPAAASAADSSAGATGSVVDSAKPQSSTAPPVLSLVRQLEQITPLAEDSTTAVARDALNRLQALDSQAQLAEDSTFTQFRFLRVKALLNSRDTKAGCDSITTMEGKLDKSRFANAGRFLLNSCKQQ